MEIKREKSVNSQKAYIKFPITFVIISVLFSRSLPAFSIEDINANTKIEVVTLDILPMPLGDALVNFAQQSDIQLLFGTDISDGNWSSPPLIGKMAIQSALSLLLDKTPFEYIFTSEDVVIIRVKNKIEAENKQAQKKKKVEPPPIEEMLVTRQRIVLQPNFNQEITTGMANPRRLLDSSLSVSVAEKNMLANYSPLSIAEALRIIPGVSTQGSSGSGFANISIRGLPFPNNAGSRFVLMQEDGLPVLQFGDIDQVYQDALLRQDFTVERVELVKHGTAATFASNSPGGIVNFISKSGEHPESKLSLTKGITWDHSRIDFGFGEPLSKHWKFYFGGHYRLGEGVREVDYNANDGGQLKLNITKKFEDGQIRFYGKYLNDRSITYLPMPMKKNGESIGGFDALFDTQQTQYLRTNSGIDAHGKRYTSRVSDGLYANVVSAGFYFEYNLNESWRIENNFRQNLVDGRTTGLISAQLGEAGEIVDDFFGIDGGIVRYADNEHSNQAYSRTSPAQLVHLADINQNDLGSVVNDIRLHTSFESMDVTIGFYKAKQNINTEWIWSSYFMELIGKNARLLKVIDPETHLPLTQNGLAAYGTPFWHNCCQRIIDQKFDVSAHYLAIAFEQQGFNLDGSLRYDFGRSIGRYASANTTSAIDVNNDGVISGPERHVPRVNLINANPINYDWGEYSYSLGSNWKLHGKSRIFTRLSRGIRVGADRKLFEGGIQTDGAIHQEDLIDTIRHAELGYRLQGLTGALSSTLFSSKTVVAHANIGATGGKVPTVYESKGVEFEGYKQYGFFELQGGISWAEFETEQPGNTNEKLHPLGQPSFTWKIAPSIKFDNIESGVFFVGQNSAYGDRNNSFKVPGFTTVSLFTNIYISDATSVSLHASNLTNTRAVTEVLSRHHINNEEWWSARSYPGRAIKISFSLDI